MLGFVRAGMSDDGRVGKEGRFPVRFDRAGSCPISASEYP
jgi:hypothetical protein